MPTGLRQCCNSSSNNSLLHYKPSHRLLQLRLMLFRCMLHRVFHSINLMAQEYHHLKFPSILVKRNCKKKLKNGNSYSPKDLQRRESLALWMHRKKTCPRSTLGKSFEIMVT
uniref:Uncharacterized protein n=1 Tax=Cacopsylla melanoneura TaxID=428564 RepID=A0A8D8R4T6_9HEMI